MIVFSKRAWFPTRPMKKPAPPVTCKHCGATNLRWQLADGGGYRLFEMARGERNQNVLHQCNAVTPADFTDLTK